MLSVLYTIRSLNGMGNGPDLVLLESDPHPYCILSGCCDPFFFSMEKLQEVGGDFGFRA